MAQDKVLQAIIKLKDDFSKPLKGVKANMEALGKSVNSTKKTLSDFNDGMNFAGKNALKIGATLTASVGGAFLMCTKNAIEFEEAFTGVMKTVNESANTSYEDISKGLIDLSNRMPKTASELAGIAEIAGQLGIETDNIVTFTETMAMLADTTNIVGEEGALQLAKFMNVMGTNQDLVDRLGSSIVALGNNFSTTEADILNMSSRLSDLGILANFSETQVLGWATAMSSAGIEAEMGGTAMKKLVTEIEMATIKGGDSLEQFAKIAGVTSSDFKKAFGEDASNATLMFLAGLNKVKEQGGSVSEVLDSMDIKEVRLRETMIKLASTHEDVARALGMSSEAWEQNNALSKEAEQRYGTTASQLQIMRNQINNATLDIGNALLPIIRDAVEKVADVANAFANLDPNIKKVIITIGLITLGIGLLLTIGGGLLIFIASVTTALTALGGVATVVGGIIAFLTSPITLVIVAIGLLIANVVLVKKAWDSNWNGIRDKTKEVCNNIKNWWKNLVDWFLNNPVVATVKNIFSGGKSSSNEGKRSAFGTKRVVGNDVPFRLHEGERVLTKQQANNLENSIGNGAININIDKMTIREEADINKVAKELVDRLNRSRLAFGGGY
jgi:TP901 family phage tail tape measure protein